MSQARYIADFVIQSNNIADGAVTFADVGSLYTSNVTENTSLYFTNARATAAVVAGAAANSILFVSSSGVLANSNTLVWTGSNLGIGTGSPTTRLDVAGNAAISGTVTLSGGTANGVLYLNGSKVATSGSALTFDGTTFAVNSAASIGSSTAKTKFYSDSTYNGIFNGASLGSNESIYMGAGIQFFYASGSEQMRLTSTGLGIGTNSPSNKLDVIASSDWQGRFVGNSGYNGGLIVEGNVTGTRAQINLKTNSGTAREYYLRNVGGTFSVYDNTAGTIPLTIEAATPSNTLYVNASGRVGIGTTSPSTLLHVNGATTLGGTVDLSGVKIRDTSGTAKVYYNVTPGYDYYSSGSTAGAIVIDTNIPALIAGTMFNIKIAGYSYNHSAPYEVNLGVYCGENNIYSRGYSGTSIPFTSIRYARKTATGMLSIILGAVGDIVPISIVVERVIQNFSNLTLAQIDGWTISRITSTAAYDNINTVSGAATGVPFSPTQFASSDPNVLDDYEEGTWTPAFLTGTFTYGSRTGYYRKIGSQVTVWFSVNWSAVSGAGNSISVTGLPFTSVATLFRGSGSIGYISGIGFGSGCTTANWYISQSRTVADLVLSGSVIPSDYYVTIYSIGELQGTISYISST
jgi:hypothetical protein